MKATTQVGKMFTKEDALLIMNNFLLHMPKTYRKRTMNWVIVKDLFRWGTSTGGSTSSCEMCIKMGIDPYAYTIEEQKERD